MSKLVVKCSVMGQRSTFKCYYSAEFTGTCISGASPDTELNS